MEEGGVATTGVPKSPSSPLSGNRAAAEPVLSPWPCLVREGSVRARDWGRRQWVGVKLCAVLLDLASQITWDRVHGTSMSAWA
jgi:hypothetical protein